MIIAVNHVSTNKTNKQFSILITANIILGIMIFILYRHEVLCEMLASALAFIVILTFHMLLQLPLFIVRSFIHLD